MAASGVLNAHAGSFDPSAALLVNYTAAHNYNTVHSGLFNIDNRKINAGFELTDKFHLHNNFFIKTGLRLNTFSMEIGGQNQIAALYDKPYPMSWIRRSASFAIPVLLGKEFISKGGRTEEGYVGLSVGIFSISAVKDEVSSDLARKANYKDIVTAEITDNSNLSSSPFITIDAGASYQPLKRMPGLSIGIMCSVQVNKTVADTYHGVLHNETTNELYPYDMKLQQSFINCGLVISYRLNRMRMHDKTIAKQGKKPG